MRAKYVIFDGSLCTRTFIFGNETQHKEMAQLMAAVYPGIIPVSAGFVSITEVDSLTDEVKVWGKSDSLNLSSRPEDERIIKNSIKLY